MTTAWQRRIDRASELARANPAAGLLLTQYAAILTAQAACFDALVASRERLTGSLESDLRELQPRAASLFAAVTSVAPAQAMRDAPADGPEIDRLLIDGWRESSIPFLARIVLQPYAEALVHDGRRPEARGIQAPAEQCACPFCGGPPQLAVLRHDAGNDGGGRALVCATCATDWPIRRILCPHCGSEDERRLGYYHTPDVEHVRVDACEACRYYLKSVDLTKLGVAIPLVDEVATGALDLWARERGYTKVTPNLIGL